MPYTDHWTHLPIPSNALTRHCAVELLNSIWSVQFAALASSSQSYATLPLVQGNIREMWSSRKIPNSDPFLWSSHLPHPQCAVTREGTTWPLCKPQTLPCHQRSNQTITLSKEPSPATSAELGDKDSSRPCLQQPYQSVISFSLNNGKGQKKNVFSELSSWGLSAFPGQAFNTGFTVTWVVVTADCRGFSPLRCHLGNLSCKEKP